MRKIFVVLAATLLGGCLSFVGTVKLSSVKLKEVDFQLGSGSLVPGESYNLVARAVDEKTGTDIYRPDVSSLNVYSKDKSLTPEKVPGFPETIWTVKVPPFAFARFQDPHYSLTVSVMNNPFPAVTKSFDLNWYGPDQIDFSGRNGAGGATGRRGGPGANGRTVELELAHYDTKGTPWEPQGPFFLIYETHSRQIVLMMDRSLSVVVRGGDGGQGGAGDDRAVAKGQQEGGDGGDGGDGGTVRIRFVKGSSVADNLTLDLRGGGPGDGGKGETNGVPGREGHEGQREDRPVTGLQSLFQGIDDPAFDRSRLLP